MKKYANFIPPEKTGEICFEETENILTKFFSEKKSLLNTRCNCMNLTKKENEDFVI